MRIQTMLLASLLVALYGCQPETPAQQSAAPAAEPAAPAPVVPAAPPAMPPAASAPAPVVESAPAAKAAPAMEKIAAAPKTMAQTAAVVKPAQEPHAPAAPAAKAEPAPAAAAPKPEAKVDAALSSADGLKLAQQSGCLVCHAIDKKVVGPAWKDVAAKYRGDAGAEARLITKVAKGGGGAWGAVAMPPNSPRVSDADIKTLVRFVLSLK